MTHDGRVRRRAEAITTGVLEALGEVLAPAIITRVR